VLRANQNEAYVRLTE